MSRLPPSHVMCEAIVSFMHQAFPTSRVKFTSSSYPPVYSWKRALQHSFYRSAAVSRSSTKEDDKIALPSPSPFASSSLSSHSPVDTLPHSHHLLDSHTEGKDARDGPSPSFSSFSSFRSTGTATAEINPWPSLFDALLVLSCSPAAFASTSPAAPFRGSSVASTPNGLSSPPCPPVSSFSSSLCGSSVSTVSAPHSSSFFLPYRSRGAMTPVLPFFPPVVVLISGYERVDMTSMVGPRVQEMIPSPVMPVHNKVEGENRRAPQVHKQGCFFSSFASSEDGTLPARNGVLQEKEDAFSSPASRVARRKERHQKAHGGLVFPVAPTQRTHHSTPSSADAVSFSSVWSCRRAPKYARVQHAYQALHTYPKRRERSVAPPLLHAATGVTVIGRDHEKDSLRTQRDPSQDDNPLLTPPRTKVDSIATTIYEVRGRKREVETGVDRGVFPVVEEEEEEVCHGSRGDGARWTTRVTHHRGTKKKSPHDSSVRPLLQGRPEEESLDSSIDALWCWWYWIHDVSFSCHKRAPLLDAEGPPLVFPSVSASSSRCTGPGERGTGKEEGNREASSKGISPVWSLPSVSPVTTPTAVPSSSSLSSCVGPTTSGVLHFGGDLLGISFPFSFLSSVPENDRPLATPADMLVSSTSRSSMKPKGPTASPQKKIAHRIAAFRAVTQKTSTLSGSLFSPSFPPRLPSALRTSPLPPLSSLPFADVSFFSGEEGIAPLLVSFGDVETSLSQLLGTSSASRREELRGAFGISLPLLVAALPSICVDAVRRMQYWEASVSLSWSPPLPPLDAPLHRGSSRGEFDDPSTTPTATREDGERNGKPRRSSSSSTTPPLAGLSCKVWDAASVGTGCGHSPFRRREKQTSSATFLLSCLFHFCALVETNAMASVDAPASSASSRPLRWSTLSIPLLVEEVLQVIPEMSGMPPDSMACRTTQKEEQKQEEQVFSLVPHSREARHDPTHRLRLAVRTAGDWLCTHVKAGDRSDFPPSPSWCPSVVQHIPTDEEASCPPGRAGHRVANDGPRSHSSSFSSATWDGDGPHPTTSATEHRMPSCPARVSLVGSVGRTSLATTTAFATSCGRSTPTPPCTRGTSPPLSHRQCLAHRERNATLTLPTLHAEPAPQPKNVSPPLLPHLRTTPEMPTLGRPSLYASVSTLLALGTVRMVLESSAGYTAWVEDVYSGRDDRGGTSSVMTPPLSVPPWRYNFFLSDEHFDTAEERLLWARRCSGSSSSSSRNDNQREDLLPGSTSHGAQKSKEDWSAEWMSCTKCLLEILL